MARLFVTSIDLNKNELKQARIQNLPAAPLDAVLGQIYFDSTTKKMYYYNGLPSPDGPWVAMSGSDEVIQDVVNEAFVAGYGLSKNYVDDPDGKVTFEIDTTETADLTTAQTLTNKTIGATGLSFNDEGNQNAGKIYGTNQSGVDGLVVDGDQDLTLRADRDVIIYGDNSISINATHNVSIDSQSGDIVLNPDGEARIGTDIIVTETDTQTLTNKTLTSPNVSGLQITDSAITFEGSVDDGFETTLQVTNPTADREITLPDATGTVALVENKLHDFALATQSVDLNSQKIVNLAEPVDPQDAATKNYVDAAVAGLTWKRAVHLASTVNVDLTADLVGVIIDGHDPLSLSDVGYRILLAGQTDPSEDGIYQLVNNSGVLAVARTTDADSVAELKGAAVFVMEGTSHGSTSWVQANHYLTDFSGQTWEQFAGASDYTAGDGLVADGNIFNVGQGLGISITANAVAIDTNVTARKYSAIIGNGTSTSYSVVHNLDNQFVNVQVYQNSSPFALVETDVELTSPTQATVKFATPPASNEYIVVIVG